MKCPECNTEVKKDAVYCHACLAVLKLPFSVNRMRKVSNKSKKSINKKKVDEK